MGEAIETTQKLYPGLLERNTNLLFMLKCRQFIEMVNGTDSEVRGPAMRSPRSRHGSGSARSSPSMSPVHHGMARGSSGTGALSAGSSPSRVPASKSHSAHSTQGPGGGTSSSVGSGGAGDTGLPPGGAGGRATPPTSSTSQSNQDSSTKDNKDLHPISENEMNQVNMAMNGATTSSTVETLQPPATKSIMNSGDSDVDMQEGSDSQLSDTDDAKNMSNGTVTNGTYESNGVSNNDQAECDMGK